MDLDFVDDAWATIDGVLEAAGESPLDVKPVDDHLTWISRALAARSAA